MLDHGLPLSGRHYQLIKIKSNTHSKHPHVYTIHSTLFIYHFHTLHPSSYHYYHIVRIMLTYDRQNKNKSTFIELKSANNRQQRDRQLEKLGGAIQASITRLKNLRIQIQSQTNLKIIAQKMAQYEKANNQYNELQVSLAELNDHSELCNRIKKMNKDFIQTYDPAQLKKKLDYMKAERASHIKNENFSEMSYINQQEQMTGELLHADKYAVRKRILEQEKAQLQEIERLINQVKEIATKTSIMINAQGEKIQLSLQKMQKANLNLKDTNKNLVQTNEYQQDTNKKFMIFCCLTVVIVSIVLLIFYSSRNKN